MKRNVIRFLVPALVAGVVAQHPLLAQETEIENPTALAERAVRASGSERPGHVRLDWEYADTKGNLRGEGVARVNPPDRFRLDFFAPGEGSMQVVLVDGRLDTLGEIEGVEIPPPAFLYAMAGVFRPGNRSPTSGQIEDGREVLEYEYGDGAHTSFYFESGRLVRVEERQRGRVSRRIELEWGADTAWPARAEYRDNLTPSRAKWELVEVRVATDPYPDEIYDLGPIR